MVYRKEKIPQALKQQVWEAYAGRHFQAKCSIVWCKNKMTCWNCHMAHKFPESKGGKTTFENLQPTCATCNLSMGDNYTIDEWNTLGEKSTCCF
jgi:5-methylcytosine-specific restriction endonuclease McrA